MQTNQSPENIFDNAYRCFFELCMDKFLRASGIWWEYFSREGRSLHQDVIEDPEKAIKQLTEGKPQLLEKVLMDKFEDALMMWAIEKMGEDFEKYVGRGLELFFTGVMIKQVADGVYTPEGKLIPKPKLSFLNSVRRSPLRFPVRLSKQAGFPFDKFPQLKKEYENILLRTRKIKKKRWRNPIAMTLRFKEILPGIDEARLWKYPSMKASQIAYDYLLWKYKLPLRGEAMKKYLNLKRIPQGLWDLELKRHVRERKITK